MSQTSHLPPSRCYGLARVSPPCAWAFRAPAFIAFSRERHRLRSPVVAPVRQALVRMADLADHIRREIEASDFHGEGYRKLWARLRVAGFPLRALAACAG